MKDDILSSPHFIDTYLNDVKPKHLSHISIAFVKLHSVCINYFLIQLHSATKYVHMTLLITDYPP